MQWFGEHEWPYINMINALCGYIGLFVVFQTDRADLHRGRIVMAAGAARLWHRMRRVALAMDDFRLRTPRRDRRCRSAESAEARGSALGEVAQPSRDSAHRGRALRRDVGLPALHCVPADLLQSVSRARTRGSIVADLRAAADRHLRGTGRRTRDRHVGSAQTVSVAGCDLHAVGMLRRDHVSRSDADSRIAGAGRYRRGGFARRDHDAGDGTSGR